MTSPKAKEGFIQQLYIQKENHRKDFEKFGNKKAIKINELNKKIKIYLENWPSRLKTACSRHDSETEPPHYYVDTHKAPILELEL